MRHRLTAFAIVLQLLVVCAGLAAAQDVSPTVDPPGFGTVTLTAGEAIRLMVVCFEHGTRETPPDPCRGELMFHDRLGNLLSERRYDIQPGETASLALAPNFGDAGGRVTIVPCLIPEPGGRAVPAVQVIDRRTRRVVRHLNPVAARMFATGETSPPEPDRDPPGFGPVTINIDQVIRLNVVCFQHSVGGIPPPCRGEVMFHDAAGGELVHRAYDLQPGEAAFIQFAVAAPISVSMLVDIVPCLLPAAGGPVAPDVEVFDRATGNVALLLGPAVARISELDQR